jgi:hypothetical protein
MNYIVIVYDEDNKKAAVLTTATDPTYSRSFNSADQVNIRIPRLDPKVAEVKVGRRFEIWRTIRATERIEVSGYISECGYNDSYFVIGGFTEEIVLTRYFLPADYGYPLTSESVDIGDFFERVLRRYNVTRVKQNWDDFLVESEDIDFITDPDYLVLDKVDADNYVTGGYVVFRFQKSSGESWDRIRWSGDFDQDSGVYTAIQYRTGATPGAGEYTEGLLYEIDIDLDGEAGAEPEVVGVVIADPDDEFLDVRVNFLTEDQSVTPRLFALEVIRTIPLTEITSVDYPNVADLVEAELPTPNVEAGDSTLLQVLQDVCAAASWEFEVVENTLRVAKRLGSNRVNDFALVEL